TGIIIAPVETTFETYPVTLEDGRAATALAPITADDPELAGSVSAAGE
ncbi:MAG: hypothetical protein K0S99_3454, partial [Thermomicrobiales bacterium]|nr:hypothetical protein [Thermomicrobiales bacterium]